jgi:hypothetical protein
LVDIQVREERAFDARAPDELREREVGLQRRRCLPLLLIAVFNRSGH